MPDTQAPNTNMDQPPMSTKNTPHANMSTLPPPEREKTNPRGQRTSGSGQSQSKQQKEEPQIVEGSLSIPSPDLTPFQLKIAERFAGLYAFAGMITARRDLYDGLLIVKSSDARAEEVIRWARNNKRAWKLLVQLLDVSDFGNMVLGHAMMGYAILSHHRGGGNEVILQKYGYTEAQVFAAFQPPDTMNGNTPDGSSSTERASSVPGA